MNSSQTTAMTTPARPWYIGLLLGASGWFAGGFLLIFVGMLFHPDSAGAAAFSGAVLLAAAWGLFKADRDGAFTPQLALALSFAGQCLVLFAMVEHQHALAVVAGAAFVLQAVMLLLMPNRLHRLMSALFAVIAWALMWRFGLFGELSSSAANAAAPSLPAALGGWLITWLPVGAALWLLIRHEPTWIARGWAPVLRPALTGLVVGIAFATLLSYPLESFRWWGNAPLRTDWLALWPLLSAGAALAAVAASFAIGSRALMGACIVAVLLHVSHFYYALGASLLLKSLLMLLMGAVLLFVARWLFARREGVNA
jgi:Domain of unknown function (DUF4401)